MHCPACNNVNLAMADRQGIEIDYCPNCRGIWLDRGELDRLIERAERAVPLPSGAPHRQRASRHDEHRQYEHEYGGYKHKRRKSLLGELFDF